MDGFEKTVDELAQHAANENAGETGEGRATGTLKWPCPDCHARYRIQKPDPRSTPLMCEFRHANGKLCGRRFYCTTTKSNAIFTMWPHPALDEAPGATEADLMGAIKLMRDLWAQPAGVHATKLYSSVADVCRIFTELEKVS